MKSKSIANILAASFVSFTAAASFAAEAGTSPWMMYLRAVDLEPADKSSGPAGAGNVIHVERKVIPDISFRYSFTKNIATELLLTLPQKHDVKVSGTNIGSFKHLPPTLLVQYHFMPDEKFSPYVGAGVNYTRITNVNLGGLQMDKSSTGLAIQAGFDYKVSDNGYLSFDVKQIKIDSNVKTAAGANVAKVKVDPVLVGIGYGFHF